MFLGLTVNGIVIHAILKVQEIFFDQDMALNPSHAATAQLVLAGFTGVTGWHYNLSQPHIVTHSYRGKDTFPAAAL